jgi:hypothetical protein
VCDSIRELKKKQDINSVLHPLKSKSKAKPPAAAESPPTRQIRSQTSPLTI